MIIKRCTLLQDNIQSRYQPPFVITLQQSNSLWVGIKIVLLRLKSYQIRTHKKYVMCVIWEFYWACWLHPLYENNNPPHCIIINPYRRRAIPTRCRLCHWMNMTNNHQRFKKLLFPIKCPIGNWIIFVVCSIWGYNLN